jgi:cytochrome c
MKLLTPIIISAMFVSCSSDTPTQTTQKKQAPVIVKQEVVTTSFETKLGNDTYKKCVSCHGANAEKKALNKSAVIAGWSASKIENALRGYKDGSYGKGLKAMMRAQVANMSDREIKSVSEYISSL